VRVGKVFWVLLNFTFMGMGMGLGIVNKIMSNDHSAAPLLLESKVRIGDSPQAGTSKETLETIHRRTEPKTTYRC
jgi:hypothetical protein